MKQYVDKSVIIAEIERRKSELQSRITELGTFESNTLGLFQDVDSYDEILSFLNTLEVKEGNDSKKDEDYINDLIDFFYQNNKLKNTKTDIISWLKSLKDRAQLQSVEYYNPYKAVVESIAEMCVHYDKADHSSLEDFYDNVRVKCKDAKEYESLFPQKQWKPSDEQTETLELIINSHSLDAYHLGIVQHLYNDLKKLGGE